MRAIQSNTVEYGLKIPSPKNSKSFKLATKKRIGSQGNMKLL